MGELAHPPVNAGITFLYVRDLNASDHFYGTVLGLQLTLDQGSCRIYRVADAAFLGVCERPERVQPVGVIVTLVLDDVDTYHQDLMSRGVVVEHPPSANDEYRIYHAFYRDPDGYLVEVQRFEDRDWAGPPTAVSER